MRIFGWQFLVEGEVLLVVLVVLVLVLFVLGMF